MGAVFAIFAGVYYWWYKITGTRYNEEAAQLHFWLTLIGVNLTFFPMHWLGLAGMPRRIPDYPDAFATLNWWASAGSFVTLAGLFVFLWNVTQSLTTSKAARA
jgi:heme/copper-type cytochrome/quinol oxidase subunit 1